VRVPLENEVKHLRQIQTLNLRSQIEQEVRDAIIRGVFKPGERLVESEIASRLGVSRAPVREVLSALERENLVVNIPRRGYFVIDFTEKDIDEIYSFRLLLEIGALRRAITRFTEEDFAEMQLIVNRLGEAASRQEDQAAIVSLDLSFHEYIYEVADHSRMRAIWNTIRLQILMLIGVTSKTHSYPSQPVELHQKILDALRVRDLATAEAVITAHVQDAQQRAMNSLMKAASVNRHNYEDLN
jgi:DNA-binding GntR family transcriptional regulator